MKNNTLVLKFYLLISLSGISCENYSIKANKALSINTAINLHPQIIISKEKYKKDKEVSAYLIAYLENFKNHTPNTGHFSEEFLEFINQIIYDLKKHYPSKNGLKNKEEIIPIDLEQYLLEDLDLIYANKVETQEHNEDYKILKQDFLRLYKLFFPDSEIDFLPQEQDINPIFSKEEILLDELRGRYTEILKYLEKDFQEAEHYIIEDFTLDYSNYSNLIELVSREIDEAFNFLLGINFSLEKEEILKTYIEEIDKNLDDLITRIDTKSFEI